MKKVVVTKSSFGFSFTIRSYLFRMRESHDSRNEVALLFECDDLHQEFSVGTVTVIRPVYSHVLEVEIIINDVSSQVQLRKYDCLNARGN